MQQFGPCECRHCGNPAKRGSHRTGQFHQLGLFFLPPFLIISPLTFVEVDFGIRMTQDLGKVAQPTVTCVGCSRLPILVEGRDPSLSANSLTCFLDKACEKERKGAEDDAQIPFQGYKSVPRTLLLLRGQDDHYGGTPEGDEQRKNGNQCDRQRRRVDRFRSVYEPLTACWSICSHGSVK
jgi:hypothetical protein